MAKCSKCGTEYEGSFCPNCGASESPYAQPRNMPDQRWSGVGVYPQYVDETHITTAGEWFLWLLLIYLFPLIGAIIMLCCAKGKSAHNFAKLQLILYIIIIVLLIIAAVLGVLGAIGIALSNN